MTYPILLQKNVKKATYPNRYYLSLFKCSCGNNFFTRLIYVKKGHTKSCGCLLIETITTHGHNKKNARSPTYSTWSNMIQRCTNPKATKYDIYGGKGIKVCARWRLFENFLADMGERPKGTSIDRIKSSGDYKPGNCRWATIKEQNNNLSSRRKV